MVSFLPLMVMTGIAAWGLSMLGATTPAVADMPPPAANAGTLTCTIATAGGKRDTLPDGATALSCEFEAISGPDASFAGVIKRIGTDKEADAQIVLSWSVLAPTPDVRLQDLEGRYMGTLSQSPPVEGTTAGLRGGANDMIELRPTSDLPPTSPEAAISVMELALHSTKV